VEIEQPERLESLVSKTIDDRLEELLLFMGKRLRVSLRNEHDRNATRKGRSRQDLGELRNG
jgi:hypothetical protein